MSKLQVLRVFLNERLTAAAEDIFGIVEKTVTEYQEEVFRLQSLLNIALQPEIKDVQQLTHSTSKPFLPPEQQLHSEQKWSSSHGQEDPEPTQIKKELEELWTSQEDNQLQGLEADNNDSNPAFVKDIQQLTQSASKPFLPSEQQLHCEQEWSSSHGQKDPEPTQIKKELEELWTSQEDDQLQGLEADNNDSNPAFVKGDYYGEQTQPSHLYQAQKEGNIEINTLPRTTSEQIKTEPDGQDYRESEPTSVSQPLSSVNLECSAGQSENSGRAGRRENEGSRSHFKPVILKRTMMLKGQSSCISSEGWESPSQSRGTPCSCKVCGRSFHYKRSLLKHVQTHTKAIEGGFCGNKFRPATDTTPPVQTHIAATLCCNFCGKCFKQSGNLKRHMRIHTGEKPYRCRHCSKGFNQSNNLKSHMRSHTGEKPFQCTDCGREFSNGSNLTEHSKIHMGEKPFCCRDCGKSFARSRNLKNHMMTHMVEKSFES